MELELCMQKFSCYQECKNLTETREFSAETIIPDYAPDISRIVDRSAVFFMGKQEAFDEHLKVYGTVKISMIYIPEGESGVKGFEYTIPIEETFAQSELSAFSYLCGKVCAVEVHPLNPRKLSTQIGIAFQRITYAEGECALCCDLQQPQLYGIETLKEKKTISYIKAIREKEFAFEEELVLSAGKEPAAALLATNQNLLLEECKVLGSKVMLKGCVDICILYTTQSGCLQQLSAQLPFSQMIDGCESDGELTAFGKLCLNDAEYHFSPGNPASGCSIDVKLMLSAFLTVYEQRSIECISDLYSTSHRLECDMVHNKLMVQPETAVQEEIIRDSIHIGAELGTILSTEILLAPPSFFEDGKEAAARIPYTAKVLYTTDSEIPYSAEQHGEVRVRLPFSADVELFDINIKQVSALPAAERIELRFTLLMHTRSKNDLSLCVLTRLQAAEEAKEGHKAPSLVLRRKGSGKSLWTLAKEYRTTQKDILEANGAHNESELSAGQMLLIPKRR